ncbi:MAG: hypothetical protein R3F41_12570 [Gammaproteobacteria bacterium]|nr:hypothetical protein [Pseudomonadales bacterium]
MVSALGEMIGAVAVFVTLIYVAYQLKQTNEISRFNASKKITGSFDRLNQMTVCDSSLRTAMQKSVELTSEERDQVYAFVNMLCNTWLTIQVAYNNGLLDAGFLRLQNEMSISSWTDGRMSNHSRCRGLSNFLK